MWPVPGGPRGSHTPAVRASLTRAELLVSPLNRPLLPEADTRHCFSVSVLMRPSVIPVLEDHIWFLRTSQNEIPKCISLIKVVGTLLKTRTAANTLQLWYVFATFGQSALISLTAIIQYGLEWPAINCSVTTLNF